MIQDLKYRKASGSDGLRKADLSIDVEQTAVCLSYIFQVSLTTGKLPSEWRTANISLLHKSGP